MPTAIIRYNLSKPELYTCVDRINKLDPYCSYWQFLSLVCPWNTIWYSLYPLNPKACAKKAGIVSKVYWCHEERKKLWFWLVLSCKNEIISMSRAWDKEKLWVPDRIRTYDLPNTKRALYPLERQRTHGEQGHILGLYLTRVLHTARISNVEIVLYDERMKGDEFLCVFLLLFFL